MLHKFLVGCALLGLVPIRSLARTLSDAQLEDEDDNTNTRTMVIVIVCVGVITLLLVYGCYRMWKSGYGVAKLRPRYALSPWRCCYYWRVLLAGK